jgi:hypothetical protein
MVTDDRFLELYDRYCDGALAPAGQEELLSLLGDPAWRARFVELAVLESAVTEELRLRKLGPGADEAMPACPAEPPRSVSRRRLAAAGAPERRFGLWVGLAAAGVLAALLPWFLKPDRPPHPPVSTNPHGDAPRTGRDVSAAPAPRPTGDATPPLSAPRPGDVPSAVPGKARPAAAEAAATTSVSPTAPTEGEPVPDPPAAAAPGGPAGEATPPQPWRRLRPKKQPDAARPAPAATTVRASGTTVAQVVEVKGRVQVLAGLGGARSPARGDQSLLDGQGLQTHGAASSAVLEFPDGTLLELGPDTTVTRLSGGEDPAGRTGGNGKFAHVERGTVGAEVPPQPAGRPLVLVTPQAEARVLGTRLTIAVATDTTRLSVHEGEVQLTRLADEALVKVAAGHFVVAAETGPLVPATLRSRAGLAALYTFSEGQGALIRDVSGVGEPLHLRIAAPDAVAWIHGGLLVHGPAGIATFGPAEKIISSCKSSGELTIEAWVKPAAEPRDGYLLALASNPLNLDFALDLSGAPPAYGVHLTAERTGEGGAGLVARRGPAGAGLRHVVYAHAADGSGTLYLDGAPAATHRLAGGLARWDANHRLALAADPRGNRPWTGEFRLVAVFSRALAAAEVRQHYLAGLD